MVGAYALKNSFGEFLHLIRRRLQANNQKFLASPAINGVDMPNRCANQVREFDQNLITDQMAELVVHFLEMVKVEQDDRKRSSITLRTLYVERK